MNLGNLLVRAAHAAGDRTATAVGARPHLSYRLLARKVGSLAGSLAGRLGLRQGDRVGLLMRNCPEYIECLFACWHAGLVAVPINMRLQGSEVAHILADCRCQLLFITSDLADIASSALVVGHLSVPVLEVGTSGYAALHHSDSIDLQPANPGDAAWLFYTSGTTGRPKGATLTHRNLLTMTTTYFADVDTIAPDDCILHAAPMSHGSGLYILPHVRAMACHIVPESNHFDADEVLRLFDRHRGVSMFAAPTMVNRLVEARGDALGLKTIVYGGGPMYVEDSRRALERFGFRLAQIYGQGETPMTITALSKRAHEEAYQSGDDAILASVGRPQTSVEVVVADEAGQTVPFGTTGEVLVRGDTVMSGYWGNATATAEALAGGWLHTGDLGSFSSDGLLTLHDRSKDLIISGGSNIYPREVEEALLRHPGVREVAVIGRRDAEWGEAPVAFIVCKADAHVSSADLEKMCVDHIARYKRPREYHFVEDLPKNAYGKVLKRELRQRL